MLDIVLHEYIHYTNPARYRSKIPGYQKVFELVSVNAKMAK